MCLQTGNGGGFEATKTKEPLYIKFPSSETALLTRFIDNVRPVLLGGKPVRSLLRVASVR